MKYLILLAALMLSFPSQAQIPPPDIDFHLFSAPKCKGTGPEITNPLAKCGYITIRNTYAPYHASKKMGCFTGDGKECTAQVGKTYAMDIDVQDEEACQLVIHYKWQATVRAIYSPASWDPASTIGWSDEHMRQVECTHTHAPCATFEWPNN